MLTKCQYSRFSLCIYVFLVCVGANNRRLQAQEQQDQRSSLPLSHLDPKRVSEADIFQKTNATWETLCNFG